MKIINLIFCFWAIIFLLFSVYTLFFYYVVGVKYVPYPFGGEYPNLEHSLTVMRSGRLFLPVGSPPFLGAATGFIALWGLIVFIKTERWLMLSLGILMLGITIMTLSRGPVLAFVLSFFFLFGSGILLKIIKVNKSILGITFGIIIVGIGILYYINISSDMYGNSGIDRLAISTDELSHSRHLELRLHALNMYSEGNILQLIYGQGLGSFLASGYGDYSFASYLTLLVETGFAGFFIFTMTVSFPLIICFKRLFSRNTPQLRFLFLSFSTMALYIILAHLFYEQKTFQCLWVQASFVFGMSQSRNKNLIMASAWFD